MIRSVLNFMPVPWYLVQQYLVFFPFLGKDLICCIIGLTTSALQYAAVFCTAGLIFFSGF